MSRPATLGPGRRTVMAPISKRVAFVISAITLCATVMSPIFTVTVGARRCQQDCDAQYGFDQNGNSACYSACSDRFGNGTTEDNNCNQQCDDYWNSCSETAIWCGEPYDPGTYTCAISCYDNCDGSDINTIIY